ncbi:hypothetical protein C4564_01510 [Candidatus Microgenomates bacterium]|nr:MAG: hypothetical protein C4564_01510 [Candidatus Microgenomates bacterium]
MPERGPSQDRVVIASDGVRYNIAEKAGLVLEDVGEYQPEPKPVNADDWLKQYGIETIDNPPPKLENVAKREPEPEVVIIGGESGEEVFFPV